MDASDYDDERVHCKDCHTWDWIDSGNVKVCQACEEWFCVECMKTHGCGGCPRCGYALHPDDVHGETCCTVRRPSDGVIVQVQQGRETVVEGGEK